jgi:ribonuclease Z
MRLRFGELSLEGSSRGGDRTWFRVHPPGLAFDVGRGAVELSGVRDVFISHGHLDHCLGLPFVLSYRARHGGGSTRVGCPQAIVDRLGEWLEAAARLEGAQYDFELTGLDPGDRVGVAPDLAVEAFATPHVAPSLGYHLVRTRRHLRHRYRGTPGTELAALRHRGVEIEESRDEDWLSYCGDCSVTVLDREPRLLVSRILLLECTFLDPAHLERAGRYGHTHIDELAERVGGFENEHLVLYHLSRRHTFEQLQTAVADKLGPLAERVELAVG